MAIEHDTDQQELVRRLREENELFRKALNETECGRKLLQQKDEFSLLLEVGKDIISELDLQKVFELVADKAREIIHAEMVVVPMINETRDHYTYMAATGKDAEDVVGMSLKIHVGMCGWVLQNENPLLFGESNAWWMEEKTTWEAGQQSALLVPLFGKRQIIGGLSGLGKKGGGSFTEHDLDLLTMFANQVSVAIENALLFQERLAMITELEQKIEERKQAEKELAAEKERLAVTLRSIGDGVITTDIQGNIVLINKIAEDLTGSPQDEAVGKPLEEVYTIVNGQTHEPCENPVKKVLESGNIFSTERNTTLISRNGTKRTISESGAPIRDRDSRIIGVVLVFRDVTEKIRMEEELLKVEKLQSVGVLAGGIAHDFNNILTAILGNLNLVSYTIDPNNKIYPLIIEAEKASLRARDLTQQLLTFAKGGEPVKEAASIREVIQDSADFVLHGRKVTCEYQIPPDLWLVQIDKGQMSQVIQNLIINADHAMPEGGTIHITCDNIVTLANENTYLSRKDDYVKIIISDSGVGIPENVIDKVFDPYFTTKQEGSGLGLAIIYSIISKHDGHISVRSEPDIGTTFTIYLPATREKQLAEQAEGVEPLEKKIKILIMDDEEIVRNVAKSMLAHLGHEVVLAKDGTEAVETYKRLANSPQPVDLVIMDLTIPGGMGGKEAIKEILAIDRDAKVIVSSGYSNDPVMSNYQEYGFSAAVIKPYKLVELAKAINKLI
jgi:PAS domain S-box-containing protein